MTPTKNLKTIIGAAIVITLILAIVVATTVISSTATAYAVTIDYYELRLGDKSLGYFEEKADAEAVVDAVSNHYITEDGLLPKVSVEPGFTIDAVTFKQKEVQPDTVTDSEALITYLLGGEDEEQVYTVKEGDTLWGIAETFETDIDTLLAQNPGISEDTLRPGDEIIYTVHHPYVTVTTEEDRVSVKETPFETVYKDDADMLQGEEKVETEGVNGTRSAVDRVRTINGVQVSSEEISSTEITKPVNKVILRGTREPEPEPEPEPEQTYESSGYASDTVSYSAPPYCGDGSAIANYALQFVGNPYVYGGTSLTNGADCSGFVYAVYNACGYSVPRSGFEYYGTPVSSLQPGDVLLYAGHYAIYIGDGMEVEALNEWAGICVNPVGYPGYYIGAYRIVG